jgi:hypothetical protein
VIFLVAQGKEEVQTRPLANGSEHMVMICLHFVEQFLDSQRPFDGDRKRKVVRTYNIKLHCHFLVSHMRI